MKISNNHILCKWNHCYSMYPESDRENLMYGEIINGVFIEKSELAGWFVTSDEVYKIVNGECEYVFHALSEEKEFFDFLIMNIQKEMTK